MKRLITEKSAGRTTQALLVKTHEVCEMLGGIHPRTLVRMEKAGLIKSVKLLRHKLYAIEDVEMLVTNLRMWNQEAAQ